jgi:DNA-3-methyladenine glycosylase I
VNARPSVRRRCAWGEAHPLLTDYHDREWGVPCRDDRRLFEFLILEGAQAGLSWLTILKKRAAYRKAFAQFAPETVARFTPARIERLLGDAGIVRNRLKVEAAVTNARCWLALQDEQGRAADFLWSFVGGRPVQNRWVRDRDAPTETSVSRAMSAELRRRGFRFVGPTICYAYMQAVGMVNDHERRCFRHAQVVRRH